MSSPDRPDARDPLDPFEDAVLTAVAADTGTDEADLRALVRRHQEGARDLPGVDDLVYEWRNYLPYDPLVARTETAYHCVVMRSVWEDFAAALECSDAELDALLAVHDRQARRAAEARGESTDVFDGATPIILARE